MKKSFLIVLTMLMGVHQSVNAQIESNYSLKEIGQTLSNVSSLNKVYLLGSFHEGLASIEVGVSKYGFINQKGKIVIPCVYYQVEDFSEGLALVRDEKMESGFIDKTGKTIIPLGKYDILGSFHEGLAPVRSDDDNIGFINKEGQLVIPFFFTEEKAIGYFHNGVTYVICAMDENGEKMDGKTFKKLDKNGNRPPIVSGLMNKQGEILIRGLEFSRFRWGKDGYIGLRSESSRKQYVIDTKGNVVIPSQRYKGIGMYTEGLFLVCNNIEKRGPSGYSNKTYYGYVDSNGNEVIPLIYGDAKYFSEGLAAVMKDDKWGYINKNGEEVIAPQFDKAFDFHEGKAFIKSENGYALIDKQGQFVSSYTNYTSFDGYFNEGLSPVMLNNRWGYVDIYGNDSFSAK